MSFRKIKNAELGRLSPSETLLSARTPLVIVLDNVRSALNVGSVFRTSDAFRIESLYLCGITAFPPNREIEKTALGATQSVNWKYFENTSLGIEELKKTNFTVLAVEQTTGSVMLNDFLPEPGKKYAFIFGHEVFGVDETLMPLVDGCIEIPQIGAKHSLNVSVSAGIVAWDIFAKVKSLI